MATGTRRGRRRGRLGIPWHNNSGGAPSSLFLGHDRGKTEEHSSKMSWMHDHKSGSSSPEAASAGSSEDYCVHFRQRQSGSEAAEQNFDFEMMVPISIRPTFQSYFRNAQPRCFHPGNIASSAGCDFICLGTSRTEMVPTSVSADDRAERADHPTFDTDDERSRLPPLKNTVQFAQAHNLLATSNIALGTINSSRHVGASMARLFSPDFIPLAGLSGPTAERRKTLSPQRSLQPHIF
ncbi:hypothetical protein C8R43DRAFT_1202712 [Mycena crocata]|nr:hypothetical protein C8R43DRAFT_1202712 [Mycena crocata]